MKEKSVEQKKTDFYLGKDRNLDIDLNVANKALRLTFKRVDDHGIEAFCDLFNLDKPRKKGSTTEIYSRVKSALTETAILMNRDVWYCFQTLNDSMQEWAKSPTGGQKIFNWDTIDESEDLFTATKTFRPGVSPGQ